MAEHRKGKSATEANKLRYLDQKALDAYIMEHYRASGKSDGEFAEAAAAALKFPVTQHNIIGLRKVLGVEANLMPVGGGVAPKDGEALLSMLATAEKRVAALEGVVDALIDQYDAMRKKLGMGQALGDALALHRARGKINGTGHSLNG